MKNISPLTKSVTALVLLTLALVMAKYFLTNDSTPTEQRVPIATSPATKPFIPHFRVSTAPNETALALDHALLEADPQKRGIAFGTLLNDWFKHDPEAALAYLRHMPQCQEYTAGLYLILGSFAQTDSLRAVTLARDMAATSEQQQIYSLLFSRIAHLDLTNALNLLELAPAGDARANALHALGSEWAYRDRNAVITWAQSLPDPADRNTVIETALYDLTDPRQTLSVALENLTGNALERTASRSLQKMIVDNPQSVGDLVNRLPTGPLQTQTAVSVARALAQQDLNTALPWAQSLASDNARQSALNNILDSWNAKNSDAAAQYVAQMPSGADQDAAVNHLAHTLATADPANAIVWARTLASDSALVNIASGWAESDPIAATQWAESLPANSPARVEALNAAFSHWILQDATAAQKFAANQPLGILHLLPR